MMTNPLTNPEDYDRIVFAGEVSPGIVKLSGHKREQSIDVKQSDGQKGAVTTWKGTKAGKFTATFELVDDEDIAVDEVAAWDQFAELLWSTIPPLSGDKPVAKDIYHPDLLRNGYKSVILDTMGEMQHDGKGKSTIAVVLSEYYPPKPAKAGGASGSKSGKKSGDPNDPIAKATEELNRLLNEGKQAPAKKSGAF